MVMVGDEHVKLDGEAGNEAVMVGVGNKGFRGWRIVGTGFLTEHHVSRA